jgi:hypothetical protein
VFFIKIAPKVIVTLGAEVYSWSSLASSSFFEIFPNTILKTIQIHRQMTAVDKSFLIKKNPIVAKKERKIKKAIGYFIISSFVYLPILLYHALYQFVKTGDDLKDLLILDFLFKINKLSRNNIVILIF